MSSLASLYEKLGLRPFKVEEEEDLERITLKVKVKAGVKHEKVQILETGELLLATKALPLEGKANNALIKKLSQLTGLSKSSIQLTRGEKGKLKQFTLEYRYGGKKNLDYFCRRLLESPIGKGVHESSPN